MEEMNGSMAGFGIMAHGVDQMLADRRSKTSYLREKSLMNKQNAMNMSNAMTMPSVQAEGLRMAGFNPAMVAGAGTQPAPTVSKGTADMAQTLPFDVASIAQLQLIGAQADKLEAETDLIRAQKRTEDEKPENVKNDTSLKIAQKLYTDANKEKVDEEAQQIRNINDTFATENDMLAQTGPVMAQKWQKEKWYSNLLPDTRATIDGIADGTIPLSVGAMNAINKAIEAQKNLSDADAATVKNAFSNAVIESQMSDKAVMDAIKRDPKAKVELNEAQTKKILAEAEKIRYKMKTLIDLEIQGKHYENQKAKEEAIQAAIRKIAEKAGNMDYARATGDYGNYAWRALENLTASVLRVVEMIAIGKMAKGAFASDTPVPQVHTTRTTTYPADKTPELVDNNGKRIHKTGGSVSYTKTESVDQSGNVSDFNFGQKNQKPKKRWFQFWK